MKCSYKKPKVIVGKKNSNTGNMSYCGCGCQKGANRHDKKILQSSIAAQGSGRAEIS